jgi:hypothetical protein
MLERLSPTIEDMAGHHIQMANTDSKTHPPKHVSLALSVAAANYAMYLAARVSQDKAQFEAMRQQHIDHFSNEFRGLLERFSENYVTHFDAVRTRE